MYPTTLINATSNLEIQEKPIAFGSHGLILTGMILLPAGASKHNRVPGVVFCHGYGNDQAAFDISARILAAEGIATLVFDFRGHGNSEGLLDGQMVEDVVDAWNFLHDQPEIDHKRMGLIGHSMGAMSAIMAAGKLKKASMLVGLACPGEVHHAIASHPEHIAYPWFRRLIEYIFRLCTHFNKDMKARVDWKKFLDSWPRMKTSKVLADLEGCSKLFVFCLSDPATPYNRFLYSYVVASEPKQVMVFTGNHNTPLENEQLRTQWTKWAIGALHGGRDYKG
ncbi:MAG: alpha/beta fold hydrolase [Dehalococcoidia bacterium]|nr:alpha/beta fold hydrolase [Dehalococcoidia bacterium]MDD5494432.1 alpha/beta fold hydrolase [Dehalococcoidia bacterium]